MEFVGQLWLPIVLSAVLVFIMSSIVHMLLPYRRTEWGAAPNQDALQNALRGTAAGLYAFPMAADPKQRMTPEAMKKWAEGPSGWLVLMPSGPIRMGMNMFQSLVLNLVVSFFAAYVAGHALPMGAGAPTYLQVFRIVGTIGFVSYAFGPAYDSIWYGKPWKSWIMTAFDSLLYGLVMAGTFGWLWPR